MLNEKGFAFYDNTDPAPPTGIGHEHVWAPLVEVIGPDAVSLGTVEGGAQTVLAMKRMAEWTSLYSMNPVLPACLLRGLARAAGVHIYNSGDDACYVSDSVIAVNADEAGRRALCFPGPVTITDPFTGNRVAEQTARYVVDMEDKQTLLFYYERA